MKPPQSRYRSVAEIEAFVDLLRAACEDEPMQAALGRLLALPDRQRRAFVRTWVAELVEKDAPRPFIQAIACLVDDSVAGKAYEFMGECRGSR